MTDDRAVFLDTNILLRYNVVETPEHQQVRLAVERLIQSGAVLWISRQVIREFCSVLTRPQTFQKLLTPKQAAARVHTLIPYFQVADENVEVTSRFLELLESFSIGGKQVHDANIVATMQVYRIPRLITLNVADFRRFSGQITIHSPNEVLNN